VVRSVRVAYFSCCILWGCSWLFIKVGLRDLPPFLFAGTRMLLASAVLLPFAVRGGLLGHGKRCSARSFLGCPRS
jgi:drug/metabolite transporter (DMT)-like permease